jgi:SprT protein
MEKRDRALPIMAKAVTRFIEKHGDPKIPIPWPEVRYDIRGRKAGTAQFNPRTGKATIRLNRWIMENNAGALEETLVHELAHILANFVHGPMIRNGKREIHGIRWQRMMLTLGADPKRCHNYRTEEQATGRAPRKSLDMIIWHCNCQEFKFTAIRHKRAISGRSKYSCKRCRAVLKPGPKGE